MPERKWARSRWYRLGPRRVQLRLAIEMTLEQYVAQKAWEAASLERCPDHPEGGCGFERHGTYWRKSPVTCQVARWYCPASRRTFSLLPDCLAAGMAGTLQRAEQAAAAVERGEPLQPSVELIRTAEEDADAVGLAAGVQWIKRRHRNVVAGLVVIAGLMPEVFGDCAATVDGFARRLGSDAVLTTLRQRCAAHLQAVPAPIGFLPRSAPSRPAMTSSQQSMRARR